MIIPCAIQLLLLLEYRSHVITLTLFETAVLPIKVCPCDLYVRSMFNINFSLLDGSRQYIQFLIVS